MIVDIIQCPGHFLQRSFARSFFDRVTSITQFHSLQKVYSFPFKLKRLKSTQFLFSNFSKDICCFMSYKSFWLLASSPSSQISSIVCFVVAGVTKSVLFTLLLITDDSPILLSCFLHLLHQEINFPIPVLQTVTMLDKSINDFNISFEPFYFLC